mmetsp:Transcript_102533/g.295192  ORF Transcript_102533/g.295192 Transcript_102533/m.295192 type:complete len:375 (+) Transcript_102533:2322-3446(+)
MVHLRRQLHIAQRDSMLLERSQLEDEQCVVRAQGSHHAAVVVVLDLSDGAGVRLQRLDEGEAVLADGHRADGAISETTAYSSPVPVQRLRRRRHACDAGVGAPGIEQLVVLLLRDVVCADGAVHAARQRQPRHALHEESARDGAGMRLHDGGARPGLVLVLPYDAVAVVLDEPDFVVGVARDVVDVAGGIIVVLLAHGRDAQLFAHADAVLQDAMVVVGLGHVDLLDRPPTQVPIVPACDDAVLLSVHHDDLDALVMRQACDRPSIALLAAHELHLDEDALPQKQPTVLRARDDFAVRQLDEAYNVGELSGAELPDVSLQLEAGEGQSHFPEADVAGTDGGQHPGELAPSDAEHILSVGLALQQESLVLPIPHR